MVKNIILSGLLLSILFFTYPLTNVNTSATKIGTDKLVINTEKNVPPPVRKAFEDLLRQIGENRGFSLSEITNSSIRWSKEKNEYAVVSGFIIGICDEGGFTIFINATFNANGELVEDHVREALCTGLIEF